MNSFEGTLGSVTGLWRVVVVEALYIILYKRLVEALQALWMLFRRCHGPRVCVSLRCSIVVIGRLGLPRLLGLP